MAASRLNRWPQRDAGAAPIEFIDLKAQQRASAIGSMRRDCSACSTTGSTSWGPEVAELETELAAFCGASTRSPARAAPMRSDGADGHGHRPGDAVLCPAFTFTATPEVDRLLGATPVFVDVDAGHVQHRRRPSSRPASSGAAAPA